MSTPTRPTPRLPRRAASPAPAATTPGRTDDYLRFTAGFRRLTRIDLDQYKRAQMERRIRSFAERRGEPDLGRYLRRLQDDHVELEAFLDRITINVSQLWRNPEQWEVLRDRLIPELAGTGSVRAWSAGCSYGAEAYTLAALLRRQAERGRTFRAEVRGTDIDERMVERAREGRFTAADARDAPLAELRAHFDAEPGGGWRASPALRKLTTFVTGDLLRTSAPRGGFDLVLCRNTVIYFNEDVRDALHARLAAGIRPGGYLVIGATERVADAASLGLQPVQPFIYRKTEA
ncbi:protein-glutamate O-methyltransferase CheR [Patulibacter sp. NPDC049589]|uniref:CheR family methyltransferase n=1 Tax=Patulibacter sp. NPDC049589 TaxID=3154731 RepID=UPI00341201BC